MVKNASNRKLLIFFEDEGYLKYHADILELLTLNGIKVDCYASFRSEATLNLDNKEDLVRLLKKGQYNLILLFAKNDKLKLLEYAKKVGIQVRLTFFDEKLFSQKLISSQSKYYTKNASRLISNSKEFLTNSFTEYSDYSVVFKVVETNILNELKNDILSPIREININLENPFLKYLWRYIKKYNHKKYWERRYLLLTNKKINIFSKLIFFYYIKKTDRIHNASFGTNLSGGAIFETPPYLPHGPNGIIVGHDCHIGREVTIYHQVTIMQGNVVIGNNVILGAGCKILPGLCIGDNVKVGANCVVVEDIPSNTTVVLNKPRIISRDDKK